MRVTGTILLVTALAGTLIWSARADVPPVPTTAPADDVDGLIARLGDPEFRVRREASSRLKQIGPSALPALRRAAESDDPEVRLRATQIIRALQHPHVPGRPQNHGRLSRVTVSVLNGRRSLDIDDYGRRIVIRQTDTGIEMTVRGEIDGRPATETYKAASAEELGAQNPEAYALYKRWSGSGGLDEDLIDPFMVRGNLIIPPIAPLPPGGRLLIQPPILQGGDDLLQLRAKLQDDMAQARLTPQQQQRVLDELDRLEQSRRPDGADDPDQHIGKYNQASDALRKTLEELKLPDPGDALPPPESSRLGISSPGDLGPDGRVVVSHVMPNSRADRIGVQEGDIIRAANGQAVHGVKDLRRIVTERAKGLVLEITRDGQDMKLREKPNQ